MNREREILHDLFIAYGDADRAWVEGYLLDALTQAGVRSHSEAAFTPGVPRLLELERAIQQSHRVLLVLSPAYLAETLNPFIEVLAQAYGVETATWPVIPLILHPTVLPARLAMLTALDATEPAEWTRAVRRLCEELQRPAPAPAPPPACPYPGMRPFGEADQDRFFGREAEVEALLQRLRLAPSATDDAAIVAVIGPSGSGKSSLVFAGLIPALQRSRLFGPGAWLTRSLRPGSAPLAALELALGGDPFTPERSVAALLDTAPGSRRLLLVVDQFEELFTLASAEAEAFQQALLQLARTPDCHVLLTARADFYPDLMACPLWREIQAHRFEITPLSGAELRQAIRRPAEGSGVFLEAALVERLITDAGREPGILPFIQETLVLLWERVERRFLPLHAYEALAAPRRAGGQPPLTGLQVAMARRADAALEALPPEQQAIARRILLRLVQFGEGRADTRRQQTLTALQTAAESPQDFQRTLEHLATRRLITLSGEKGDAGRADIAHEALIGGWPALQGWLAERREAEQTRRRLEAKAAEWERLGRAQGGLLDEVELLETERWLKGPDAAELGTGATLPALAQASRAALEAAARERESAQQRELALERQSRQRLLGVVAILGLLVLAGAGWLVRQEILRQSARIAGSLCAAPGLSAQFECDEVTEARYARCVTAGRCTPPPQFDAASLRDSALPVTQVDALQAATFCDWIGRRLPTRAEWLHAATQGGRSAWPWGAEEPASAHANLLYDDESSVAQETSAPEAVGGRPLGATPEGIHDLIGNVWEWTATPWEAPGQEVRVWNGDPVTVPRRLIMQGGGYQTSISGLGAREQPIGAGFEFRNADLGFRCIAGALPPERTP